MIWVFPNCHYHLDNLSIAFSCYLITVILQNRVVCIFSSIFYVPVCVGLKLLHFMFTLVLTYRIEEPGGYKYETQLKFSGKDVGNISFDVTYPRPYLRLTCIYIDLCQNYEVSRKALPWKHYWKAWLFYNWFNFGNWGIIIYRIISTVILINVRCKLKINVTVLVREPIIQLESFLGNNTRCIYY